MEDNKSNIYKIIIIVLALALIASFAYIVLNKKTDSSTKEVVTSSASYPSTSSVLSVPEWGIEGHYLGDQPLKYKIENNVLRFTSDSINSVCGYDYSGFITRYTADQHIDQKGYGVVPSTTKDTTSAAESSLPKTHIGDYYYIFTGPQSPCIADANSKSNVIVKGSDNLEMTVSSAQGLVSNEIHDAFLTLTKK